MRIGCRVIGVGEHGAVGLTLHDGCYGPIDAARFGAARWLHARGTEDRLESCTRPIPVAILAETMQRMRQRLSGAVAGVHRQLDWAESHFSDTFREMPSQAGSLGGNVLLLGFLGELLPHEWRVIDVSTGQVLWRCSSDDLKKAGRVSGRPVYSFMGYETELLMATGRAGAAVRFSTSSLIVEWSDGSLAPTKFQPDADEIADHYPTMSGIVTQRDREKNEFEVRDPHGLKEPRTFRSTAGLKGWCALATSPDSDRIALPHKGGTVEIIDAFGGRFFQVRPFPRVGRNEHVDCRLSASGRFLGCRGWTSFRVVDLDRLHVAEMSCPVPNMSGGGDQLIYDSDIATTDEAVVLMQDGKLSVQPFSSLKWQAVQLPAGKPKRTARKPAFESWLARWRKPAIRLEPAGTGRTRLYGMPDLPEDQVPRHEGRPMQLLARVDLSEVSAVSPDGPWPKEGALYFFIAIDEEGEPLVDEMFNPSAVRVVWSKSPFGSIPEDGERSTQPLLLAEEPANLPDIAAAIVESSMLEDADLEDYRAYLENNGIADQTRGHRLGGYPTIVQNNDLEAQAAHFADDAEFPPRDIAELAAAARWRLLLQLDSDDEFMWGTDSGMLYFLIHDDDLSKGRFDRVVAVCEGY